MRGAGPIPRSWLLLVTVLLGSAWGASALRAQQTLNQTLMHDGVVREYILYIPASYDGTSAVPLMFNFHGYQMSAATQMAYADMRGEADAAGFILVYPQGTRLNGGGATHWNVGSWTAGSTADDLGFTEAMIDAIASSYAIDQERVYSTGYSNGGYFSFELACKLSDRIAAIGSVAGTMSTETLDACAPVHPMPILQIHGTSDFTVWYNGAFPIRSTPIEAVLDYWADFNSTNDTPIIVDLPDLNPADGSTVQYYAYEDGERGTTVDHYKVVGGGHDWPDLDGDPGDVNVDISASQVVWDFVSRYDINGLIGATTGNDGATPSGTPLDAFPNPTRGMLSIRIDGVRPVPFRVHSLLGRVVMEGTVSPGGDRVDLSVLAAGVYVIHIEGQALKVVKL